MSVLLGRATTSFYWHVDVHACVFMCTCICIGVCVCVLAWLCVWMLSYMDLVTF